MAHNAVALADYDFKPEDELLLDANIWLFVYGPQPPQNPKAAVYSEALKKIIAVKSCIYIDVLIVSEFINRYARIQYQLAPSSNSQSFKGFRRSSKFRPIALDIAAAVKRILQHCTRIESGFEPLAIDALLDEYAAGASDFNDQILATLCKAKGLKLVTDDADFKSREIIVVTANRNLLV